MEGTFITREIQGSPPPGGLCTRQIMSVNPLSFRVSLPHRGQPLWQYRISCFLGTREAHSFWFCKKGALWPDLETEKALLLWEVVREKASSGSFRLGAHAFLTGLM